MRSAVVVLLLSLVLCPTAKAEEMPDGGRGLFAYLGLGWLGEGGGNRLLIGLDGGDERPRDLRLSAVPPPSPRDTGTDKPQPSFSLIVIWRF